MRPLPVDGSIRAVINFGKTVIQTTATVRNATKLDDDRYRIGCAITQIAEHHKRLLDGYAADQHTDRRRLHPGGLVSKIRSAA